MNELEVCLKKSYEVKNIDSKKWCKRSIKLIKKRNNTKLYMKWLGVVWNKNQDTKRIK